MSVDYNSWIEQHAVMCDKIDRFCELDVKKDRVKCGAAMCVINNAMQDIDSYLFNRNLTYSSLCFLIRNVDVVINAVLDLYNILLGVGLNKAAKAEHRCFTDGDVIHKFRHLRSLILAHPIDTYYDEQGRSTIVYLEDVRVYDRYMSVFHPDLGNCDFVKYLRKPNSDDMYYEPLSIDVDIIPVLDVIIASFERLTNEIDLEIKRCEERFINLPLDLDKSSINSYILSLDKELEKRYPSCIENVIYEDGHSTHWSIVYDCLLYFEFESKFDSKTRQKYDIFLNYIRDELKQIESDLKQMKYDSCENQYFKLIRNIKYISDKGYEESKMKYLLDSNASTYDDVVNGVISCKESDAACGIKCFCDLIPYIEEYIPVDVNTSDKGLYCQYLAATYLSQI